jgi:Na+-translocating ferredoxin:NAD+ oxidoreductase RnfG subunit
MKEMIKEVITLTLIALICSTLIYLAYHFIGGIL